MRNINQLPVTFLNSLGNHSRVVRCLLPPVMATWTLGSKGWICTEGWGLFVIDDEPRALWLTSRSSHPNWLAWRGAGGGVGVWARWAVEPVSILSEEPRPLEPSYQATSLVSSDRGREWMEEMIVHQWLVSPHHRSQGDFLGARRLSSLIGRGGA